MKESDYIEIKTELDSFINKEFRYKATDGHMREWLKYPTYCVHRVKIDLYLRFAEEALYCFPAKTIVIARIGVKPERKGKGNIIVNHLIEIATKYGFEYLGIESANENSTAFGKKIGFSIIPETRCLLMKISEITNAEN